MDEDGGTTDIEWLVPFQSKQDITQGSVKWPFLHQFPNSTFFSSSTTFNSLSIQPPAFYAFSESVDLAGGIASNHRREVLFFDPETGLLDVSGGHASASGRLSIGADVRIDGV